MPMRQILATFGLACPLIAGVATPAVAQLVLAPLEPPVGVDALALVRDDLGWQCDPACDVEAINGLRLEVLARNDEVGRIADEGEVIYINAADRHEQLTFTYRVVDRASGVSAPVQVNLWIGYRATAPDELAAVDGAAGGPDAAGRPVDQVDKGDIIELVGIQCPKHGHLFLTEVNGRLKVFFQPDTDFTGATYFRYASAGQAGSVYQPAALAGAVPSPADDDRAEGMVREQSLASPS
jgi:hypothetical protein